MTIQKSILCLILVLYVLGISACGTLPKSDIDDSTGANSESAAQSTENMQTPLNYQSAIVNVALKHTTTVKPEISRLTYDSYSELINTAIQTHGDDCHVTCTIRDNGECSTLSRLKTVAYSEEFFSENTLLLITFNGYPHPFTVDNVTREGNIVTCTLNTYYKPLAPDEGIAAWSLTMSVFVAVDTVLPQETEFQVTKNYVPVEAEEYTELSNDFFVKYIL